MFSLKSFFLFENLKKNFYFIASKTYIYIYVTMSLPVVIIHIFTTIQLLYQTWNKTTVSQRDPTPTTTPSRSRSGYGMRMTTMEKASRARKCSMKRQTSRHRFLGFLPFPQGVFLCSGSSVLVQYGHGWTKRPSQPWRSVPF